MDKTIENANSACDEDDCAVPDSGLVFQWGREVTLRHCHHLGPSDVSPQDCSTAPYTTDDVGLPAATLDYTGAKALLLRLLSLT